MLLAGLCSGSVGWSVEGRPLWGWEGEAAGVDSGDAAEGWLVALRHPG